MGIVSGHKCSVKISTFLVTIYVKELLIRKGLVASLTEFQLINNDRTTESN